MLGIEDIWVSGAYLLCICSSLLCVIYGLIAWNKGEAEVTPEDMEWALKEDEVQEKL
ncbi:MAG: hypothetical protein JW709_09130 [Sedimentisphaerales bacterium]|nr:hypothetical protein [Sedimentisphaerales bacterium]